MRSHQSNVEFKGVMNRLPLKPRNVYCTTRLEMLSSRIFLSINTAPRGTSGFILTIVRGRKERLCFASKKQIEFEEWRMDNSSSMLPRADWQMRVYWVREAGPKFGERKGTITLQYWVHRTQGRKNNRVWQPDYRDSQHALSPLKEITFSGSSSDELSIWFLEWACENGLSFGQNTRKGGAKP